jgi:hypothetical protein
MTLADKIGYWPSMACAVIFVGGIIYFAWKKKIGPFKDKKNKK